MHSRTCSMVGDSAHQSSPQGQTTACLSITFFLLCSWILAPLALYVKQSPLSSALAWVELGSHEEGIGMGKTSLRIRAFHLYLVHLRRIGLASDALIREMRRALKTGFIAPKIVTIFRARNQGHNCSFCLFANRGLEVGVAIFWSRFRISWGKHSGLSLEGGTAGGKYASDRKKMDKTDNRFECGEGISAPPLSLIGFLCRPLAEKFTVDFWLRHAVRS